jgi:hypothetical protein
MNPAHPAPVEFPIHCEVKVNNVALSINVKGKKSAAKVLALNINKDKALYFGGQQNKIDLLYQGADRVSHSRIRLSFISTFSDLQKQNYIMSVAICEVRNSETLARRVRRDRFRAKGDVLGASESCSKHAKVLID